MPSRAVLSALLALSALAVEAQPADPFAAHPGLEAAARTALAADRLDLVGDLRNPFGVFGASVAVDGDRAAVGAANDFVEGVGRAGAVYVFRRDGTAWTLDQRLTAGDGVEIDRFGRAVALDGGLLLVGAPERDDWAGAVYAFERTGGAWVESAVLTAGDATEDRYFGQALALDGDRVLVGAAQPGPFPASFPGRAYVFEWAGGAWTETAAFSASDATESDRFGTAVALDGDRALIGAHGAAPEDVEGGGAAYVFDLAGGTWAQTARLTEPDSEFADWFGYAVALAGGRAFVGAPLDDDAGANAGAVHVFEPDGAGWVLDQTLTTATFRLGDALTADGDRVLVGAPSDAVGGTTSGAAFVFERVGGAWTETARLEATDPTSSAFFGRAVALDGDRALVGAPGTEDLGSNTGSAYAFDLPDPAPTKVVPEAPLAGPGHLAGRSVAVDGDRAVVGAPGDDEFGTLSGAAYVFDRDPSGAWRLAQRLDGGTSGSVEGDRFGEAVAVSGDRVLIGSPLYGNTRVISNAGRVHVYDLTDGTWTRTQTLFAVDPVGDRRRFDLFGNAVALDGDRALVGAVRDDGEAGDDLTPEGPELGAAYVFERTQAGGWVQRAKLVASDGQPGDFLGVSVSLDRNRAVVGALGTGPGSPPGRTGAAYVFERAGETWTETARLTSASTAPGDRFGETVAVSGRRAVVGARLADGPGGERRAGAAYVFERSATGWAEASRLVPSAVVRNAQFGTAVGLDGDRAAVGAYRANGAVRNAGAAVVFDRGAGGVWAETARVEAGDGERGAAFGWSVAVSGATVVVGAVGDDAVGLEAGAAYVTDVPASTAREPQSLVTTSDLRVGLPYPNPTRDTLWISIESSESVYIEIFDSIGRSIQTLHLNTVGTHGQRIGPLPPGPYFVRVSNSTDSITRMITVAR